MSFKCRFSVIVPAYGVEKYILRALKSIQNQTFTDFEVIITDDCSKDKTGVIAADFAGGDGRFSYIRNSENLGLSGARNRGLSQAGGEYVIFMDSDDYWEDDLLEKVDLSLKKNPADAVVFGLVEEYGTYRVSHSLDREIFSRGRNCRRYVIELEAETLYGYAWNKAYRRELLAENELRFENIRHIEDILFNIKVFDRIESLNILPDKLYHYEIHGDGLTGMDMEDYFELQKKRIEAVKNQHRRWRLWTRRAGAVLSGVYHRSLISALQRKTKHGFREVCAFLRAERETEEFSLYKNRYDNCGTIAAILYRLADFAPTGLNALAAFFVAAVRSKNTDLFNKLKQNR